MSLSLFIRGLFSLEEKVGGLLSFPQKERGKGRRMTLSFLLKRNGGPPSPLKGIKRKGHPSSLFFLLLRREGGWPSLFSSEGEEE